MGLLDFLGTPEGQGLLAAGFGAMTSRNPVAGIGRGGLLGLQTYAGAKDQQMQADRVRSLDERQNKLFGMQEADFQARQDAARRSLDQQQSQQNYLGSIGQVTSPRLDAQPNQADPRKMLALGIDPKFVETFMGAANLGKAKIKDFRDVRNPDGSVSVVGFDEFGNTSDTKQMPFKAPEVRDFGGYVGGIDPITGKVANYGQKTMSAAERDASSRGWSGLNLQRDQFAYNKTKDGLDRADKLSGGVGNATEGERKAATLLQRLRGSKAQLDEVTQADPSARSPGVVGEFVRSFPLIGGDVPANLITPENRQRVEAAQLDMLDAALTLGTGAAYTQEQLRGYAKSYFPQVGDDPKTISDKQARLNNVIKSAEIAAGRAAPAAQPAPSQGGWSIRPK